MGPGRAYYDNVVPDPVGVGQGSVLSPILSAIAIIPALNAITRWLQRAMKDTWTSLLFYVDDGTIIVSSESFGVNTTILRFITPIVFQSFQRVGCLLEPSKLESAGFPLTSSADNPYKACKANPHPLPIPPLQIQLADTVTTLQNNPVWRYLNFFLDTFLTFKHHVQFYANKALSTARALPILGNSKRGLPPHSK